MYVFVCVHVFCVGAGGGGEMDMAIPLCHSPPHLFVDSCGGLGGGGGAFQITVPELFWAVVNREEGPWSLSAPAWETKVVSGARTGGIFCLGKGY